MIKQLILIPTLMNAININGNNLIVDLTNSTANIQYSQNYNEYATDETDYFLKSTNNTQRNEYIDIHTNNYAENHEYEGNVNLGNFYIAQITPYYNIDSTQIDLHLKLEFNFSSTPNTPIRVYAIKTTDTYAQNYIDRTDWANAYKTNEYWNDLVYNNNLSSFTWIYDDEEYTYPTNIQPGITIDINNQAINKDETTYYIIYTIATPTMFDIQNQDRKDRFMFIDGMQLDAIILNYGRSIEVVDIPGLMFTVLTMPFAFISQAFDLTLFPGTAYQINISQLFLGLIGVAMLLWVLKIILGRANIGDLLNDSQKARNDRKLEKLQHKNKMEREEQRHQNAMQEKSKKDK